MRRLIPFSILLGTAIVGFSTPAPAQRHNLTVPQHHNTGAQPMHFPNNSINFPNNAINFPNNAIHFPNNAINFPNNSINFPNNAIGFPVYAGGYNGRMNYSNANYGMGNYGGGYLYSPYPRQTPRAVQSVRQLQATATNPAMMMGMGVGVGSTYAASHNHHRSPHHSMTRATTGNGGTPMLTATQRHYDKLVSDLDTLTPQFAVADVHRNSLKGDMMAVSTGGYRPDATAIQQLSTHLADGMTRRSSQAINTSMIADDVRLVINSGQLPQTRVNQAISQTSQVLKEGGFRPADIQTVAADMQAVAVKARTQVAAAQAKAVK